MVSEQPSKVWSRWSNLCFCSLQELFCECTQIILGKSFLSGSGFLSVTWKYVLVFSQAVQMHCILTLCSSLKDEGQMSTYLSSWVLHFLEGWEWPPLCTSTWAWSGASKSILVHKQRSLGVGWKWLRTTRSQADWGFGVSPLERKGGVKWQAFEEAK
jgi:hypothetical protein